VEVPDDAGLDAWKAYAKVERAGAFVIRPTWLETEPEQAMPFEAHGSAPRCSNGGRGEGFRSSTTLDLLIDPMRTFGSGSHASTRLALGLLSRARLVPPPVGGSGGQADGKWPANSARHSNAGARDRAPLAGPATDEANRGWSTAHPTDLSGRTVLDVGVGSGILAIAAARLGATNVVGVDIDPESPTVTAANALANGVADRIAVLNVPLRSILGVFDVVVANILAPVLIDLAGEIRAKLSPGGIVILAGFLAEQEDAVLAAYSGLKVVDRSEDDGWSSVCLAAPAISVRVAPPLGEPRTRGDSDPRSPRGRPRVRSDRG
jgi:ribosomal protein L11 methylase PrmA